MEYRTLGKSGLKVSEIGLGGASLLRLADEEAISVIRYALGLGINFIDTSDFYGTGRNEEFIGKAVKGKRSEVIIATKVGLPKVGLDTPDPGLPNDRGTSRWWILQAIDASLKRLNTDYVDLYYLHWPDPKTPIEETLRTLDGLVRAGKVRYIGCSNFAGWQLCEAMWLSRVNNLEHFIAAESHYNLLDLSIESELVPCCQAYGVGVVPYMPLASGFLTGKYQRRKAAPAGSRLAKSRGHGPPLLTEANYDKLEKLQAFAAEHGHTMLELAFSWLLSHPWLSSVIAGATKPEQVSANAAAGSWKMTAQEVGQLEELLGIKKQVSYVYMGLDNIHEFR